MAGIYLNVDLRPIPLISSTSILPVSNAWRVIQPSQRCGQQEVMTLIITYIHPFQFKLIPDAIRYVNIGFNGEVIVYDSSLSDDPIVGISHIDGLFHHEPIQQVRNTYTHDDN